MLGASSIFGRSAFAGRKEPSGCVLIIFQGSSQRWLSMRLQFLPGVIIALISLLRADAYAQMRDQSPTDWRTFEVPEFGTRIQVPATYSLPLVSRNEGVVSGLNVLTDALPYRFTLARTIRERTRQLTCGTICAWTALRWTMCG